MKKLIPAVLAAAVLAGVVYAAGPARYDTDILVTEDSWTIANSLATNVALLSGDNGGAKLIHGGGLAVCVSAESGQTITSGTMRAYVYMPVDVVSATSITWRWIAYPALDWVLAASVRDQYSGDKSSLSGLGRFAYVEDNIVASGGTTVQTTYSMRSGIPR